jgi:hypothetical protein
LKGAKMKINDILKTAKIPLSATEASRICNNIYTQKWFEQQAATNHEKAQNLRLKIQKQLKITCEEYYKLIK